VVGESAGESPDRKQPMRGNELSNRVPVSGRARPELTCGHLRFFIDTRDATNPPHPTAIGFWLVTTAKAGDLMPWDPALARAFTYKDLRTSITFYVESDGKHVAAIDAQGTFLWVRSPWKELDPSDTRIPVIDGIKVAEPLPPQYLKWLLGHGFKAQHAHVRITFASRAFGILDEKTGDFILEGQN